MPFYVADYEADTSHLTMEEDGAYNRLLRLCWRTPGCSIPDDDAWIARMLRADEDTMARVVRPILAEFFKRRRGRLFSPRQLREFERAKSTSLKRSLAGSKGGRPRKALKENEIDESRAEANEKHPEPEPEPRELREETPCIPLRKRGSQLPPNWVPSDCNIADAEARGFSAEEIEHEGRRFRDHHLARGTVFKDWDAAWRTWLGNARAFARGRPVALFPNAGSGRGGASLASIAARRRAEGKV
jgi:uncharacterized protein YdaU (DUF1376 family)